VPFHAAIELMCTLRRSVRFESGRQSPHAANGPGTLQLKLHAVPIDSEFMDRYPTTDLPQLKAGDLLFLALARGRRSPRHRGSGVVRKGPRNWGTGLSDDRILGGCAEKCRLTPQSSGVPNGVAAGYPQRSVLRHPLSANVGCPLPEIVSGRFGSRPCGNVESA
jgi:hypothetical protein